MVYPVPRFSALKARVFCWRLRLSMKLMPYSEYEIRLY
jgi:hypothetical protein